MPFSLFPLSFHPGRGHGHLAQGDGAVVGRRQGMGEHLEATRCQGAFQPGEQQGVLHHAAGQGHQVQPGPLPDQVAGVGQEPDQGVVEAGGDGGGGHAGQAVGHHAPEDGQGIQDQGVRRIWLTAAG